MIWLILPTEDRISWEGHLSGYLIGLFYAFFYRNKGITKEEFSKTEFDLLFDENGNLIQEEDVVTKESSDG